MVSREVTIVVPEGYDEYIGKFDGNFLHPFTKTGAQTRFQFRRVSHRFPLEYPGTDDSPFIKRHRPHFMIRVRRHAGVTTTSLLRIDFRGYTSHLRVGNANLVVWEKRGRRTATYRQILKGIETLTLKLSPREIRGWHMRLINARRGE